MKLSVNTLDLVHIHGDRAALQKISELGYTAVDYTLYAYPANCPLYTMHDTQYREYFLFLKEYGNALGISFDQTHAHIPTPFTSTAQGEKEQFQIILKDIQATAYLECPYIVIHPAIPRKCIRGKGAKEAQKINAALFKQMKPVLQEYGVKLAVENMFNADENGVICSTVCSSAEEMLAYINILGTNLAVACLDIGHANLIHESENPTIDPCRMIDILGDKLKLIHMHDNDGHKDFHNPPGQGNLPWHAIMTKLASSGYRGNLSFELKSTCETALSDAHAAFVAGKTFLAQYFHDRTP